MQGWTPTDYARPNPVNMVRRARYRLRLWLRGRGVVSARERRDIAAWHKRSEAFLQFMQEGLASGGASPTRPAALSMPRCEPVFDGRFVVGVECRRELQAQLKGPRHV